VPWAKDALPEYAGKKGAPYTLPKHNERCSDRNKNPVATMSKSTGSAT